MRAASVLRHSFERQSVLYELFMLLYQHTIQTSFKTMCNVMLHLTGFTHSFLQNNYTPLQLLHHRVKAVSSGMKRIDTILYFANFSVHNIL